MTRSELIREIGELGISTARVRSDVANWLNRGQRAIAQRRNFTWMHSQQAVTMLAGATSANLPTNYKALSAEKSPITYTDPTQSQFPRPVQIKSRAELERMAPGYEAYMTNALAGYGSPYYVFLEQNDGGRWTINVPQAYPILTNITYAVSCFLFPADLTLGTDHNPLTDDSELCEALINWVKAKAFGAIDATDPQVMACTGLYEAAVQRSMGQDARRALSGRDIRW